MLRASDQKVCGHRLRRLIFLLSLGFVVSTSCDLNALASRSGPSSVSSASGLDLAIGFPHGYDLNFEHFSSGGTGSWSIGAGYIPTISFNWDSVPVQLQTSNIDLRGRWHPLHGGFFLGLATGLQNIQAAGTQSFTVSGQSVPTQVSVSITDAYLIPHAGFIWHGGSFIFGLEAGSQMGFGSSSKLATTVTDPNYQSQINAVEATTLYQAFQTSIQNSFNRIGNANLLYAAIRLGWVF